MVPLWEVPGTDLFPESIPIAVLMFCRFMTDLGSLFFISVKFIDGLAVVLAPPFKQNLANVFGVV